MTLRGKVDALAQRFADELVRELRAATLDELRGLVVLTEPKPERKKPGPKPKTKPVPKPRKWGRACVSPLAGGRMDEEE